MKGSYLGIGYLGLIILLCVGSHEAFAHARHYAFTEEYKTLPQNSFEIESRTSLDVPDHHVTNANTWEYQQEVEYGVTDHLTVAHYELWDTENTRDEKDVTRYKAFKFETKYRIAETGKYWLDPLLYLEWETEPREKDNPNTIEGKIVLSKNLGRFNVSYNQIMESKLGEGGRTEHEYAIGVNYEILDAVHVGVEAKGQYWNPGSRRNEIALGPAISYEGKYMWVSIGCLFGVNHATDDFNPRVTAGIPF